AEPRQFERRLTDQDFARPRLVIPVLAGDLESAVDALGLGAVEQRLKPCTLRDVRISNLRRLIGFKIFFEILQAGLEPGEIAKSNHIFVLCARSRCTFGSIRASGDAPEREVHPVATIGSTDVGREAELKRAP